MQFKILANLIITCSILSGCTHIYGTDGLIKKPNDGEYLSSHCDAALKMPADINAAAKQDDYPLPMVNTAKSTATVSIEPPDSDSKQLAQMNNQKKRSFFSWFKKSSKDK